MIGYADLLSVPYAENSRDLSVGLNCGGVCDVILQRMGWDAGVVPVTEQDALAMLEEAPREWTRLGKDPACASRDGDVVLSQDACGVHSAIVVDVARKTCLTATPPKFNEDGEMVHPGGVFAVRVSRLRDIQGIYRLGGRPT